MFDFEANKELRVKYKKHTILQVQIGKYLPDFAKFIYIPRRHIFATQDLFIHRNNRK